MMVLFLAPLAVFCGIVLGTWLMGRPWVEEEDDDHSI
jgi:hypothetical protein